MSTFVQYDGLASGRQGEVHPLLAEQDTPNLRMAVHNDFELKAKKIQEYTGAKNEAKEIHALVAALEHICAQACTELEEEYTTLKNTIA